MQQWHNELSPVLSLDGEWQFSLGGQSGKINVPGTWEAQGYPRHVDGPAVYERQVEIPEEWRGSVIQLQFDAISYYVEVEVNGESVGSHTGLWSPFAFRISDAVRYGELNTIRLTTYKPGGRFPMRESLAGFLPDVCLTFGGIWQNARLAAFPAAAISDVLVMANADTGAVTITAQLQNAANLTAVVVITAPDGTPVAQSRSKPDGSDFSVKLPVNAVQPWSPEHPALYTAEISLEAFGGSQSAKIRRMFGFRTLSRDSDQVLLNDVPVCLRGVLNWGFYPEPFCPAPDEAAIRDEFRRVRSAGYNMVKLCLVVPSPLYFEIADQEGMLLWLELPMWLPQVTERLRQQAPIEYADILSAVHHHPSIIIYSLGCEMNAAVDNDLLSKLNTILRERTSGVLVCDNSGSGEAYGGLVFDYADFNDYHFYADLQYFTPLLDHFRRDFRPARPWIFGEFCDADDYRDVNEIAAAHGGQLPWWLAEQNPLHPLGFIAYSQQPVRMPHLDIPFDGQDLQRISRQQSFVVRKTILEKVRARASMGGYVVTGLRDTPIASSAMFDDLSRAKYDAGSFREFNSDSVIVLEQGRRRTWKNGGDRPRPLDRNNYAAGSAIDLRIVLSQTVKPLPAGQLQWRFRDMQNHIVQSGTAAYPEKQAQHIPVEIASLYFTAPNVTAAQQYTLEVELENGTRNHWLMWVYPAVTTWSDDITLYDPSGVLTGLDDLYQSARRTETTSGFDTPLLITGVFAAEIHDFVQQGGRAIVLQTGDGSLPVKPCPFWREGIKLLYNHPVLQNFPHQNYADLQFYHLAADYAIDADYLIGLVEEYSHYRPIMQRLDARQFTLLDYLVELKIGRGTLLASTLRFTGGEGDQVLGLRDNIAGRHLLAQMIDYLLNLHS